MIEEDTTGSGNAAMIGTWLKNIKAEAPPPILRYGTRLQNGDLDRIESAIEHLTKPDPATGARLFDVDYHNPETDRTLFHYAIEYAASKTEAALLHAGAAVDAECDGKRTDPNASSSITALSFAEEAGADEVVAMLHAWKTNRAIAKAIGNVARYRTAGETPL